MDSTDEFSFVLKPLICLTRASNHSAKPNLRISTDAHYATRGIKAGEELLINYNELGEPEVKKQNYYKGDQTSHL